MSVPASRCGWLLVSLIIFLSVTLLTLASFSFLLNEHLRSTSLRQNQTKAIYLAQAGVMRALYDFRNNPGITLAEQTVDAGPAPGTADDDVYTLQAIGAGSAQRDVLLLNMRGAVAFATASFCSASRSRMTGWVVRNVLATGGASLIIQSFKVNWSPNVPAEGILRLDLNGTASDWQAAGCVAATRDTDISLVSVPVAQRTLSAGNPGTRWATNRVWFTSNTMDLKDWIDITFTMTDGSSRTSRWDRLTVANRQGDLIINSVGEVRRGAFPFILWRRLQATYRICATVSGASCDTESEERTQPGSLVGYQELTVLTP